MMYTKLVLLALGVITPAVGATKASLLEGTCEYNTYMCCWTRNDNGVQDNTDVCSLPLNTRKLYDSEDGMVSHESTYMLDQESDYDDDFDDDRRGGRGGMGRGRGRIRRGERSDDEDDDYDSDDVEEDFRVEEVDKFAAGDEGDVHCHGFVWADGAHFEAFILPLYKYVRSFDHRHARGYYGRIRGAPMCECIEKMPVVSRADCTTYSSQGLVACEGNDLRTHYDQTMQRPGGRLKDNLVETCPNA